MKAGEVWRNFMLRFGDRWGRRSLEKPEPYPILMFSLYYYHINFDPAPIRDLNASFSAETAVKMHQLLHTTK